MKTEAEEPQTASLARQEQLGEISKLELSEILDQHQDWVASDGLSGMRADLSRANFEGVDLAGATLRGAFLRKTSFARADLSSADLQGALLIQADLRGANLLGTKLRGANLQGANLDGATGLLFEQLAGTNLFGALLPKRISETEGWKTVSERFKIAQRLLVGMILIGLLVSLVVARTRDLLLAKNSPALPIPHVGEAIPMVSFYLLTPLFLFGFYVYFHFALQRLWQGLAGLPTISPDGRALEKTGPWLLVGLASNEFKWFGEDRLPSSFLEGAIPKFLSYWLVPCVLVLLWARYLTRQDLRSTMLQVFLVILATALASFLPDLVRKTLRADLPRLPDSEPSHRRTRLYRHGAIPLGIGVLLSSLSVGTICGVPHDTRQVPALGATDFKRWAANTLWAVGYNPYAELSESNISTRPANWTGQEAQLPLVKGADLDQSSFRYAEAYRAFLVNAHLWQADFESANLSEADLSGANLREANLQSAVLDHAKIMRANLRKANLEKADLTSADLHEADLAYAILAHTTLADAKLEGASLYAADLSAAWLLRANLEKTDLREAQLGDAKLEFADLREAYLWSSKLPRARLREAQLQNAILIDANLRGADLRDADLQGAILRGADLGGANLERANFHTAKGLTAAQICSAAERRGIELDQDLQHQADAQCGNVR